MPNINAMLSDCVARAAAASFPELQGFLDTDVRRSQHADFQSGVALPLAKRLGKAPRQIAQALCDWLKENAGDSIADVSVAGPGFLNINLPTQILVDAVPTLLADKRLGVPWEDQPTNVVVDYSSPNVAKEMHVGHLRGTIIGDALVRVLSFQGHNVIRQNHTGDWGTPFGMLIEHLIDCGGDKVDAPIGELSAFYKAARGKFDEDDAFKERARLRVVALQRGDEDTLVLWRKLVDVSQDYFMDIYGKLGVCLVPEDFVGESFYNSNLPAVISDLQQKGLAQDSQGAVCVFPEGFTGREGDPLPLIVRKQDGGYGYATTDLAALRHRVDNLKASRILYLVGAPQAQHLEMVFAVGRLAGWADDSVQTVHVSFGSVLGPDKKMLKSRSGEAVKLIELLDEGIGRAQALVKEKAAGLSDPLSDEEIAQTGRDIGIGSIKYADLSNDRSKDYVFDWNRMLAFEGDTAPYLMYAHARISSILRNAGFADPSEVPAAACPGDLHAAERALLLQILDLPVTIERCAAHLQPHRLCQFLYGLATAYSNFYRDCPVLKAEPAQRAFRLALCGVTAQTLALGLDLLGVAAPKRM